VVDRGLSLRNSAQKLRAQRNETLLELAKLELAKPELAKPEFDLRLPAKRYQRKSSPDLGPAHQDFVH